MTEWSTKNFQPWNKGKQRQIKKQTLNTRVQTDGDQRGGAGGWGRQVMGTKEGTCPDEHGVM